MSIQIFKKQIPNQSLFELFEKNCIKNDKFYTINTECYKKGIFNNSIPLFIEMCRPYYHLSKQKYLERKLSYNSFITIIRQICKFNKITYTYEIKYDKSKYDIFYYIYLS